VRFHLSLRVFECLAEEEYIVDVVLRRLIFSVFVLDYFRFASHTLEILAELLNHLLVELRLTMEFIRHGLVAVSL